MKFIAFNFKRSVTFLRTLQESQLRKPIQQVELISYYWACEPLGLSTIVKPKHRLVSTWSIDSTLMHLHSWTADKSEQRLSSKKEAQEYSMVQSSVKKEPLTLLLFLFCSWNKNLSLRSGRKLSVLFFRRPGPDRWDATHDWLQAVNHQQISGSGTYWNQDHFNLHRLSQRTH